VQRLLQFHNNIVILKIIYISSISKIHACVNSELSRLVG